MNHSGLDLGTLGDLPAHGHEDVADALGDELERVSRTDRAAGRRCGDVDRLLDEQTRIALDLELALTRRQGFGDLPARHTDPLAGLSLGGRR